jgi:ABC-type glycerol-3-phosphate transport system permease component
MKSEDDVLQTSRAVAAALPTLAIYTIMGRYFVRGLLVRSVKG